MSGREAARSFSTSTGHAPGPSVEEDLSVVAFGFTDRGRKRSSNEDQFAVVEVTSPVVNRGSEPPQSGIRLRAGTQAHRKADLLVVADGVGGHPGGGVASLLAVRAVEHCVCDSSTLRRRRAPDYDLDAELMRELESALHSAHEAVRDRGSRDPELEGMGTTLTCALIVGRKLFVTHAGDSRCYVFREGRLRQVTRDHTIIAPLLASGAITRSEAAAHPFRHMLTNAVGGSKRWVLSDAYQGDLRPSDVLLLCTDGLTQMVTDERIARVLARRPDPADACDELVSLANEAGGEDNITVIVACHRHHPSRP